MKKFVSVALAGAIILSAGVFCPAPNFSTIAEENVEYTEVTYENVKYRKYADHVEVGDNSHNENLTEVVILDKIEDLPVTEIGDEAFVFCTNLKSVKFPKNIKRIGNSAFASCGSLELNEIPNTVTEIGYYAFYFCHSLKSVIIPDSVTSIGAAAFYGLSITSVTIPNSITKIEPMTFYYCEDIESITIPDSVTEIGDHAFEGCSGLTSVTIPNSVTKIGGLVFYNCKGLESITIENPDCEIAGIMCGSIGYNGNFEFNGTIYGYPNSTAQAYAEKYGYKFEPIGEQPPTEETETLYGDANLDGDVTIADSVAILQYLANGDEYALSEKAEINADCCNVGDGVNTEDALAVQKLDAKVISDLPVESE